MLSGNKIANRGEKIISNIAMWLSRCMGKIVLKIQEQPGDINRIQKF